MKRKAIDDENKPYYYEDYRDSKNYLKPREFFINSINKQGLKGFLYNNNDDMRMNIILFPNSSITLDYDNYASQLYIQNIKKLKNINDIYFFPCNDKTEKYIKTKENIFKIESHPEAFTGRFLDVVPLKHCHNSLSRLKELNKNIKTNGMIKIFNTNKIDKNITNEQVIFAQLVEMNLRCIANNLPYKPRNFFSEKQLNKALDFQRKNPDKVFEIIDRTTMKLIKEKITNIEKKEKEQITLREKISQKIDENILKRNRKR